MGRLVRGDPWNKLAQKKHLPIVFKGRENAADQRGKNSSADVDECLRRLDEKEEDSVMCICFGSILNMADAQHHKTLIEST